MKVINLKERLDKDLELYIIKEFEKDIVFMDDKNEVVDLYKYDRASDSLDLVHSLKVENSDQIISSLEYIDGAVHYFLGSDEGLIYKTYDLDKQVDKKIYQAKYDDYIYLDRDYLIGIINEERLGADLISIEEDRVYPIRDKNFYSIDYSSLKIIKNYICWNKRNSDSYDIDEKIKFSMDLDGYESGVYLVEKNSFIEAIKRGETFTYSYSLESGPGQYIEAGIISKESYIQSGEYNFMLVDLTKRQAELRSIDGDLRENIVTSIDYSSYPDSYNLRLLDNPLSIEKATWLEECSDFRFFYPEIFHYKAPSVESLQYVLNDKIITSAWEEPSLEEYYDYTTIRDRYSLKEIRTYLGLGFMLWDKVLLIY